MARKSGFEEMVEAAALLPWYVSFILACGSYLFLHALSLEPVPTASGQMSKVALIGISTGLQYLVPLIFLCGALFSFLHSAASALFSTRKPAFIPFAHCPGRSSNGWSVRLIVARATAWSSEAVTPLTVVLTLSYGKTDAKPSCNANAGMPSR